MNATHEVSVLKLVSGEEIVAKVSIERNPYHVYSPFKVVIIPTPQGENKLMVNWVVDQFDKAEDPEYIIADNHVIACVSASDMLASKYYEILEEVRNPSGKMSLIGRWN